MKYLCSINIKNEIAETLSKLKIICACKKTLEESNKENTRIRSNGFSSKIKNFKVKKTEKR
jgi:hypothetical protein